MEEIIDITIPKDEQSKMIEHVSQEISIALMEIMPPFDEKRDMVRLRTFDSHSERIKLIYEVQRGVRLSKAEQNRSPYREKGITMHAGRMG